MKTKSLKIENESLLDFHLEHTQDSHVKYRLAFLNALRKIGDLPRVCEIFRVAIPTGYAWVRKWNEAGFQGICHPFHESDRPVGRPAKLSENDLNELKTMLLKKNNWLANEIQTLILKHWGVTLSLSQVARILKYKLKMHFSKPYL